MVDHAPSYGRAITRAHSGRGHNPDTTDDPDSEPKEEEEEPGRHNCNSVILTA